MTMPHPSPVGPCCFSSAPGLCLGCTIFLSTLQASRNIGGGLTGKEIFEQKLERAKEANNTDMKDERSRQRAHVQWPWGRTTPGGWEEQQRRLCGQSRVGEGERGRRGGQVLQGGGCPGGLGAEKGGT